ncbi:MAG: hypothetical protein HY067_00665 [Betaproteobacteria bacterium]|nr:hypothetical protein [Betaproteobacteria bacterium]
MSSIPSAVRSGEELPGLRKPAGAGPGETGSGNLALNLRRKSFLLSLCAPASDPALVALEGMLYFFEKLESIN